MQMLGHIKESRGHIQLCKTTSYLKCSPFKKKNHNLSKQMGGGGADWVMFLFEDGVGWSGESSPPPDDSYRNNKLNIPRTEQSGSSSFHSVATA